MNHYEQFYRLAYTYVKNADDAQDIVQESILKAMTSLDSLNNPQYLKTWFCRIVVNTALDFLRKQNKFSFSDEDVLEDCSYEERDNTQTLDLHAALEQLSPNSRSVIVLRYFEDLKLEEIGDVLDINVSTVKTRLYTALKRLRIDLDDISGGLS